KYAPLVVGENVGFFRQNANPDYASLLRVQDIDLPGGVEKSHAEARIELLRAMQREFINRSPGVAPVSHKTAYDRAVALMNTDAKKAFNIEEEKSSVRDAYGRNLFGQGCLLARRLVEKGVPFVEVTLAGINGQVFGWDTHGNNFEQVKALSAVLD